MNRFLAKIYKFALVDLIDRRVGIWRRRSTRSRERHCAAAVRPWLHVK